MTRVLITAAFIGIAFIGIPLLVGAFIRRHGLGDRRENDNDVFWTAPPYTNGRCRSHFTQRDGKP